MIKDPIFQIGTPEECGVRSQWVENLLDAYHELGLMMHSVILVRHGKIFAEGYYKPFGPNDKHRMYSISKTFASTAIGLLVGEGKVALDDKVIKYFPDKLPENVHPYIADMTIRELLCMHAPHRTTTYYPAAPDWAWTFFNTEPNHPAGTFFFYDTSASYTLDVIAERLTGKPYLEYLKDKFLREAGFSEDAWCVKAPEGNSWGGSGVICTPRDLAKLAFAYLNGGVQNGKQVIPADYVKEATSAQVDNASDGVYDWVHGHGYGYQIWRSAKNAFGFYGMGSQFAFCFPDKDMMFICTADTQGTASAANLIFSELWHQVISKVEDEPFEADAEANAKLQAHLDSLSCRVVDGKKHTACEEKVNGKWFEMNENPMKISKMMLEWNEDGGVFHYVMDGEEKAYPFGAVRYEIGEFPQLNYYGDTIGKASGKPYRCMACGSWTEENKFVLRTYLIDNYFGNFTATFGFKGDQVGLYMVKTAEWFLDEYQGMAGGKMCE